MPPASIEQQQMVHPPVGHVDSLPFLSITPSIRIACACDGSAETLARMHGCRFVRRRHVFWHERVISGREALGGNLRREEKGRRGQQRHYAGGNRRHKYNLDSLLH